MAEGRRAMRTEDAVAVIDRTRGRWRLAYRQYAFGIVPVGEYDFASEEDVELRVAAMGLERVGETYVNWKGQPVIPLGRISGFTAHSFQNKELT